MVVQEDAAWVRISWDVVLLGRASIVPNTISPKETKAKAAFNMLYP